MLTKVLSEAQFNKKYPLLSDRQLKLKYGTSEGAVRAWDSRGRGTQTPKTETSNAKSPNFELASLEHSTVDKLRTAKFSERHSLASENISNGINVNEFVTIEGDGQAIYKSTRYRYEAITEEYVYNLDKQLGFGLVPPTVCIPPPTNMAGVAPKVIQARALDCKTFYEFSYSQNNARENIRWSDSIKMQILDDIIINEDRHTRNFLVTNKTDKDELHRLIAIDNGMSFVGQGVLYSPFFSTSNTQKLFIEQSKKVDFTNEIKSIRDSVNKINPEDYVKQIEEKGIGISSKQHTTIVNNIKKWQSDEHWKSITK